MWPDPEDDERNIAWVRDYYDATAPHSEEGGYINFMADDDQDRIRANYKGNYDRLAQIKRTYDPAQPVPAQPEHRAGVVAPRACPPARRRDRRRRRSRVRPGGAAERGPCPRGAAARGRARLRRAARSSARRARAPRRHARLGPRQRARAAGTPLQLPRGKVIGGCSTTNGAFALRGSPSDFDAWSSAGNPGWAWTEVLDSFNAVEHDLDFGDRPYHGSRGPIPIRRYAGDLRSDVAAAGQDAIAATGVPVIADHNAPGAVGVGPVPVNEVGGTRLGAASTYLAAARGRPNLTVRGGALVDRVIVSAGRVTGVRLASGEAAPRRPDRARGRRLPQPGDPDAFGHRTRRRADRRGPRRRGGPARCRPEPGRPSRGLARPRVRRPGGRPAPVPAGRDVAQRADGPACRSRPAAHRRRPVRRQRRVLRGRGPAQATLARQGVAALRRSVHATTDRPRVLHRPRRPAAPRRRAPAGVGRGTEAGARGGVERAPPSPRRAGRRGALRPRAGLDLPPPGGHVCHGPGPEAGAVVDATGRVHGVDRTLGRRRLGHARHTVRQPAPGHLDGRRTDRRVARGLRPRRLIGAARPADSARRRPIPSPGVIPSGPDEIRMVRAYAGVGRGASVRGRSAPAERRNG